MTNLTECRRKSILWMITRNFGISYDRYLTWYSHLIWSKHYISFKTYPSYHDVRSGQILSWLWNLRWREGSKHFSAHCSRNARPWPAKTKVCWSNLYIIVWFRTHVTRFLYFVAYFSLFVYRYFYIGAGSIDW